MNGYPPPQGVRQPHKTKSKGIGGPGGPVRINYSQLVDTLEVWGVQCNPNRVGMTGEARTVTALIPLFRRLVRNPNVQKQFSQLSQCKACVERGSPVQRLINGRGLCLVHEYLRGEGLLGYVVRGRTYATCRVELSL